MNKVLKIDNLKKIYHDSSGEINAIKNISLDVFENEFLVLIGPSGCGKSTILSILANLEKSSCGDIKFNRCHKIGYMLQDDALFPWLTVRENCLLGLKITKNLTNSNIKYIDYLLDTYGMKDFKDKYPSSLSGGMRQRVALIRTLATNPDILLLDEPFSKLDYQTRLILSDDIYRIIKEQKKTAIMVSHDLAESISLADRIVVLSKRPCEIKNIYNINLTDKSNPINNRKCKEFSTYYEMLWRDLDAHL